VHDEPPCEKPGEPFPIMVRPKTVTVKAEAQGSQDQKSRISLLGIPRSSS
jgi:hypothetical protein